MEPSDDRLLAVLDAACRFDGPVRLVRPKGTDSEPGLIDGSSGANAGLLTRVLGSLLEEVPRAPNQARRVQLTGEGIRCLLVPRSPEERAARARLAPPFYRERVLRVWKQIAEPAEAELVRRCVGELYGDLVQPRAAGPAPVSDATTFKRSVARELVANWSRAEHPEAKSGLARVMIALGLQAIGGAGDQVVFNGRAHLSEDGLFPGDPAVIVEPGWMISDDGGELLLQKAKVKPFP